MNNSSSSSSPSKEEIRFINEIGQGRDCGGCPGFLKSKRQGNAKRSKDAHVLVKFWGKGVSLDGQNLGLR